MQTPALNRLYQYTSDTAVDVAFIEIGPMGPEPSYFAAGESVLKTQILLQVWNTHHDLASALQTLLKAYYSPKMAVDIVAIDKARSALLRAGYDFEEKS